MTKAQRIVVVVYCVLLVYCCLWIPWRVQVGFTRIRYERLGYGWLWKGPAPPAPLIAKEASVPQKSDSGPKQEPTVGGYTVLGEYDPATGKCSGDCGGLTNPSSVAALTPTPPPPLVLQPDPFAEPDLRLIALRFIATTVAAIGAVLVAGMWKSPATRN